MHCTHICTPYIASYEFSYVRIDWPFSFCVAYMICSLRYVAFSQFTRHIYQLIVCNQLEQMNRIGKSVSFNILCGKWLIWKIASNFSGKKNNNRRKYKCTRTLQHKSCNTLHSHSPSPTLYMNLKVVWQFVPPTVSMPIASQHPLRCINW